MKVYFENVFYFPRNQWVQPGRKVIWSSTQEHRFLTSSYMLALGYSAGQTSCYIRWRSAFSPFTKLKIRWDSIRNSRVNINVYGNHLERKTHCWPESGFLPPKKVIYSLCMVHHTITLLRTRLCLTTIHIQSRNTASDNHAVVWTLYRFKHSCQILKIAGCACAGNAGNVFPAIAGWRSRHVLRHVLDVRAVMHAGIAN